MDHTDCHNPEFHPVINTVESPSITNTTGTKDSVLYGKVSFVQGVIVDHAPLAIVAGAIIYAGARLWTIKSVMLVI